MKKLSIALIFTLCFTPLFSQNNKVSFFEEFSKKDVFKYYKSLGNDVPWVILESSKNKFQFSYEPVMSTFKPFVYTYHFNKDDKVILEEEIKPKNNEDLQQLFNKKKFKYEEFDSNPKVLKEGGTFMNSPLIGTIKYTVKYRNQTTNVQVSKCRVPKYNEKGTVIRGYDEGVLVRKYPQTKTSSMITKLSGIDLKSEDMIYNIKNYVYFFLFQIENPTLFHLRQFTLDALYDAQNPNSYENRSANNKWYLNYEDIHTIRKYDRNHISNCEYSFGDKAIHKIEHNQLVCPSNSIPKEIKIEYRNLDDDAIAMAIGNIFDNDMIHIVIDSRKFKNASPSKRAFVMWHELYHSLGVKHGECGPLMFPYIEKNYTWEDWDNASIKAVKCFNEKRNYGKKISNEKI